MSQKSRCSRPAFTLIELLIVVAIIGILMALLMPTINNFRTGTMRSHCANNLKAIHHVLMEYARNNNNNYPEVDSYYGSKFYMIYYRSTDGINIDKQRALKPLYEMINYGASRRTFFCPFHRDYDRDSGRPASWDNFWETESSTTKTIGVEFGYVFFINRGSVYGHRYLDGRPCVRSTGHPGTIPLVADDLHARPPKGETYGPSSHNPESWFHGGGQYGHDANAEAMYNSDCNTLLGNGTVVWKDWEYLQRQGPVYSSSSNDLWWCYQGYDAPDE